MFSYAGVVFLALIAGHSVGALFMVGVSIRWRWVGVGLPRHRVVDVWLGLGRRLCLVSVVYPMVYQFHHHSHLHPFLGHRLLQNRIRPLRPNLVLARTTQDQYFHKYNNQKRTSPSQPPKLASLPPNDQHHHHPTR